MKFDYLIVGSGLFGATFAYRARQAGKTCLVIDKRPHLGGNLYCRPYNSEPGTSETRTPTIWVHEYGPHIFHTSNPQVWDFVTSLVPFNRFTNAPLASYHGTLYNLPFNMNTFSRLWPDVHTPAQAMERIESQRFRGTPRNLEEQALSLVGTDIYNTLIREYTQKQWGRPCSELPAFIIRRLPVRFTYDNNYFNDRFQGIPIGGYNALIARLLDGSDCLTGIDFFKDDIEFTDNLRVIHGNSRLRDNWRSVAKKLVFSGALDEYFDFRLGRLDWRTVTFRTRVLDTPNYQGNAVINYTSADVPYTRVIEHKHFEMFGDDVYRCPQTVVSEEYSAEYQPGMEPYYPVNDDRNNALADAYRRLAEQEENVIFGGRLAQYRYYDMAPIIEQVLTMDI